MTEEEWVQMSSDEMHAAICRFDVRRRRLFAVACCRVLGELLVSPAPESLQAVELFADTGKTKVALRKARQALRVARSAASPPPGGDTRLFWAFWAIEVAASENAYSFAPLEVLRVFYCENLSQPEARRRLFSTYRDFLGPPESTPGFVPAWQTSTAIALATQMYDSRDFSPMPILADALQDVGCTNEDILNHCRDEKQVHVRGCWVVDLVLGKV